MHKLVALVLTDSKFFEYNPIEQRGKPVILIAWLFNSRTDDLKLGNLVGEDKYGNKYYENNAYFVGKFGDIWLG